MNVIRRYALWRSAPAEVDCWARDGPGVGENAWVVEREITFFRNENQQPRVLAGFVLRPWQWV